MIRSNLAAGALALAAAFASWHLAYAQPALLAPAGEEAADIRPVECDSEGSGPSREAAISSALSQALAQEGGVSVGGANVTATLDVQAGYALRHQTDTTKGKQGDKPAAQTDTTNESVKGSLDGQAASGAVIATSGGRILRYQVISVSVSPEGGFVARVHATLQLYRRQSSAADLKRSISIGTFTGNPAMADALHDALIIDLTQTHRFRVVDRQHDDEYQREIGLLQSSDASPGQRAHAGQVVGADYILSGKLSAVGSRISGHPAQTTYRTIELTGEVVSQTSASTVRTSAGSAAALFELMEVSTREIRMADKLSITGTNVESLAQRIADDLIATIYPPRLIAMDDPASLVLSQGGNGISIGQRFDIMQQGTELFDPYTHESLGKREREVGVIEVSHVEPKLSYARLVSGVLPDSAAQSVLRPQASVATPALVSLRRKASVHVIRANAPPPPDQGLRLPFDR